MRRMLIAVLLAAIASAGCDSGPGPAARSDSPAASSPTVLLTTPTPIPTPIQTPIRTRTEAPTSVATPSTTPTPAGPPPFRAVINRVTAANLGASWHPGCPVGPDQLRQLTMTYWGFDARAHTGRLVVNTAVATSVVRVFAALYQQRFPIRRMEPVSTFGGSDDASMAADNTSGFNCRNAVAAGPPRWSAHAYGKAIDVNTVENPYLDAGKVLPPAGAAFTDRSPYRPGMAVPGGTLVKAFAAVGWSWGGRWSDPDYQHFSSTGG
jgi:hypothetical protein